MMKPGDRVLINDTIDFYNGEIGVVVALETFQFCTVATVQVRENITGAHRAENLRVVNG